MGSKAYRKPRGTPSGSEDDGGGRGNERGWGRPPGKQNCATTALGSVPTSITAGSVMDLARRAGLYVNENGEYTTESTAGPGGPPLPAVPPRKTSIVDIIFTPRMDTPPKHLLEGTFYITKKGSLALLSKKRTVRLMKAASKDVGNAYFIECVDAKGNSLTGFPLALSSGDELRNANELRYEFELDTAAAGVHVLRFELIDEFSKWKRELEAAIGASKKRTQRGSLVLQVVDTVKAAFQSGDI